MSLEKPILPRRQVSPLRTERTVRLREEGRQGQSRLVETRCARSRTGALRLWESHTYSPPGLRRFSHVIEVAFAFCFRFALLLLVAFLKTREANVSFFLRAKNESRFHNVARKK